MGTFVNKLVDSRDPRVKIHTISFMLGGKETTKERAEA